MKTTYYSERTIIYDGIEIRIESFEIEGAFETKIKHQAFWGDHPLSEIEETNSKATMDAIAVVDKERNWFNEQQQKV